MVQHWSRQWLVAFWRKASTWVIADLLLIGTNLSEILIEILAFSFNKIRLEMSPAKWRQILSGEGVRFYSTVRSGTVTWHWSRCTHRFSAPVVSFQLMIGEPWLWYSALQLLGESRACEWLILEVWGCVIRLNIDLSIKSFKTHWRAHIDCQVYGQINDTMGANKCLPYFAHYTFWTRWTFMCRFFTDLWKTRCCKSLFVADALAPKSAGLKYDPFTNYDCETSILKRKFLQYKQMFPLICFSTPGRQ